MNSEISPVDTAPIADAAPSPHAATEGQVPVVVYADCLAALEEAWRLGLPKQARVRTMAPAILAHGSIDCEPASEYLSPKNIEAIHDALLDAAEIVWARLGQDRDRDEALVAARSVMVDLQNYVYPAAQLLEEDFRRPIAVVAADFGTPDLRRRFYYVVASLMSRQDNARIVDVPAERLPRLDEPAPPDPHPLVRLANANRHSIAYRLARAIGGSLPPIGPRGSLLILRENELLRACAPHLATSGFMLRDLVLPRFEPVSAPPDTAEAVQGIIEATTQSLSGLFAPSAVAEVGRISGHLAQQAIARYRSSLEPWRREVSRHARYRPRGVLSNMLVTPEAVGLHRVLRERKIPLISFEHGIASEICSRNARSGLVIENAAADLAVTFNEPMAALCNDNPFGGGPAIAAGLPRDYRSVRRRQSHEGSVWYVRTTLFQSNLGRFHRGLADDELLRRETAFIDQVLARLPHPVVYKPYPAIRYVDPDPILAQAASEPSIEVYEGRLDLRYVARKAAVLVTRGATSTISWCVMSERPTVFVKSADHMPLRPEVQPLFEEALFVVDGLAEDFHDQIRSLLSKPISEIDRAWAAKSAARRRLVEQFLSTPNTDAGKSAADGIRAFLDTRSDQIDMLQNQA